MPLDPWPQLFADKTESIITFYANSSTTKRGTPLRPSMVDPRLPSLAVGNGRMLATLDSNASILSVCWPCIDSPNQIGELIVKPLKTADVVKQNPSPPGRFGYENNTNIAFGRTEEGLNVKDMIFDLDGLVFRSDVHARRIEGPHPQLAVYIAPELDGRLGAQTIYWDESSQALLAYCRDKWLAVGSQTDKIFDFHCGRRSEDSSGARFWQQSHLPRERISFRHVDGILRIRGATDSTTIFFTYGHTRDAVLGTLEAVRKLSWDTVERKARGRSATSISGLELQGWAAPVDRILRRSCLVLDVLTNRDTGGTIAGPDVQSGIESAPGYAAVWGRDAAWTMLGALAMGCKDQVRKMIQFALKTHAPEGLWLHRHHTDGTLASSWGLHQIDETGIYLHAFACYFSNTSDRSFLEESWSVVMKAATFLLSTIDQKTSLPIKSVDLWEEREGLHLYTAASVVAGIRAASYLARQLAVPQIELATKFTIAGDRLQAATLEHFWKEDLGRFVSSTHSSAGLPMLDDARPDLSAVVQDGFSTPETPLPQYPNWRDDKVVDVSLAHDVSILSLAVPFGILSLDDARVAATVEQLRQNLWSEQVGGLCRYTADTYGGGNPWPLATLWLAIYEAARGNSEEAMCLIDWVVSHTTESGLVPEQVHKTSGMPVAAVPLSWSHGMVALAVAAVSDRNVWRPNDSYSG